MKKRMKKLLAMFLGTVMTVGLLAGCGSAEQGTTEPGTAEGTQTPSGSTVGETVQEQNQDTLEQVTLKMYLIGDKSADFDAVYDEVNKILSERLNCTLSVDFLSWSEHATKYSLLFSGGEDFDLIFTASQWCHYETTVGLGGFHPMSEEFIQTYAPGVWAALPPLAWEQAKVDGTAYMVPYNNEQFGQETLAVRGDLMEKYEITSISDWDEYIAFNLACAADGIYGSQGNAWWQYFQSQGRYVTGGIPKDGELLLYNTQDPSDTGFTYILEWDAFREYCMDMKKMADAGCWSPDILNSTDERQTGLLNGTTASMVWNMGTCRTYAKQANAEHPEWKVTLVDPIKDMPKKVSAYINGGMSININSKNKERAMMVINELYTNPELQDLTMLGIEGKHWEAASEDQYKILDASGYPTDNNCNWGWTNQNLRRTEYIEDRTELDDVYDAVDASYKANVKVGHPLDGFSFDTTNVSVQCAAVEAATGTYYTPLVNGLVRDVDATIAEWRAALESAGIQDIIAELNRQAEAFLAER